MTSLWRQKRAEERDDAERSIGIEAEMLALRRKATLWGASEDQESITSFSERWEALSNWFPAPVVHQGVRYPTVEHAFQAAKAADDATAAAAIRKAESAKEAHALGQQVPLPAGWERSKLALMESLLRDKFRRDSALRERLLRTEQMNLIATNGWGETFWGVSAGKGSNALGKALMKLREEARTGTDVDEWLTSSFELVGPSDPCDGVKLEVYKSGALVDTLPLDGARAVFIVGKHSNCDVKLDHPSISRRHAAIIRDQSRGLLLVDLASKAGTTLAGRRAPPSTAVPLKDGSRVVFGGSSRTHVVRVDKVDALKLLAEQHAALAAQLAQLEKDASDESSLFGLLPAAKRGPDPTATSVFVGNLNFDSTEEEVKDFFEEYTGAKVASVRMPKNRETGEPTGIGFLEFETPKGATAALALSGDEFNGRTIKVDVAERKPRTAPQPRAAAPPPPPQQRRAPPPPPQRRDQSPPRRNQSPPRRDQSPPRRDHSPPRRHQSPPRRDHPSPRRERGRSREGVSSREGGSRRREFREETADEPRREFRDDPGSEQRDERGRKDDRSRDDPGSPQRDEQGRKDDRDERGRKDDRSRRRARSASESSEEEPRGRRDRGRGRDGDAEEKRGRERDRSPKKKKKGRGGGGSRSRSAEKSAEKSAGKSAGKSPPRRRAFKED